jgi:hypothetical protein
MKYPNILRAAAVVLAVAASGAHAQSMPTPSVMTDTAPLPAQERGSVGAVVFEDSMVIAHRQAFQQAADRTGLASIGRNATRAMLRQQTMQDLAALQAQEAARLRDRGAMALDEK